MGAFNISWFAFVFWEGKGGTILQRKGVSGQGSVEKVDKNKQKNNLTSKKERRLIP